VFGEPVIGRAREYEVDLEVQGTVDIRLKIVTVIKLARRATLFNTCPSEPP
jgi:hypothetical protein